MVQHQERWTFTEQQWLPLRAPRGATQQVRVLVLRAKVCWTLIVNVEQQTTDTFDANTESDAVNSLYMLAQTGSRNANQFAIPNQPHPTNNVAPMQHRMGNQSQDTSPTVTRVPKHSIGSVESNDYDGSDASLDNKPSGKGAKGKKGVPAKTAQNGRRKADEAPGKAPANKRAKSNGGGAHSAMSIAMGMDMDDDSDEGDIKDEMNDMHPSGRKMTDEEKRKNFLERNRYVDCLVLMFATY